MGAVPPVPEPRDDAGPEPQAVEAHADEVLPEPDRDSGYFVIPLAVLERWRASTAVGPTT